MKTVLCVCEHDRGYQIGWYISDEQEFGLMFGHAIDADPETAAAVAAITAAPAVHPENLQASEWFWESKGAANKALKVAKAAIKAANSEKPMPDWATKAISEGWKMPKGWVP